MIIYQNLKKKVVSLKEKKNPNYKYNPNDVFKHHAQMLSTGIKSSQKNYQKYREDHNLSEIIPKVPFRTGTKNSPNAKIYGRSYKEFEKKTREWSKNN